MSRSSVYRGVFGFIPAILCFILGPADAKPDCPEIDGTAHQLILVLAPTMASTSASVHYFKKDKNGKWQGSDGSKPAVLGKSGLGWSWAFRHYASTGDAVKKEGDGRTPAGFFPMGPAFGFGNARGPAYVRLQSGKHYCVDDPASPYYNAVVPRSKAGQSVSGEDMAAIPLYREGLFIDYPTNREESGGSCIFIHVWKNKNAKTAGCVALSEKHVKDLQSRSASGATIIGILPRKAWTELKSCFLNP